MRIRSIRPEFWRSDDIDRLDWHTRLVFIGLWSYVDDNGVGRDRVSDIAADLFATDLSRDPRETFARVAAALQALHEGGQIARYEVDGRGYIHVVAWKKHQRVDNAGKGRYPLPTCENADLRESLAKVSRDSRESRGDSPLGEGEKGRSKRTPSPDGSGAFDAFWSAYPRKVGKDAARKAWDRAVKRSSAEDVMAGLQHWLPLARETEERFRPYPATWLNEGRWKDETSSQPTTPGEGDEWTDEALDDFLGPDRWQLPGWPEDLSPGTPAFHAWVDEQRSLRRQERIVEANRRMNLRVAR